MFIRRVGLDRTSLRLSQSGSLLWSFLPAGVFREANPDYGIEGQIEVFDQDNKATGLMFLVQLKGTDQPDLNDSRQSSPSAERASRPSRP